MANYVFETSLATNQTLRVVGLNGYVAQRFGTGHNVNATNVYRVRMRVSTSGSATFKVAFYWGNGPTATLHSETTFSPASATGASWFEHVLPTPILSSALVGQAFEIRVIKTAGNTVNVIYNNEGYAITGGSMVSATSLGGAQSTVSNGVSYFGILERDPVYSGNTNASAYTQYTYSGTAIGVGSQFTAPWAFNVFEAYVSGTGGTGVVSVDLFKGSPGAASLVGTTSKTLTGGTGVQMVSVPMSETQVSGEYYYMVRPTNGSFRMYSDTSGAETRSLYYDGTTMYTGASKWTHRITKDLDYVIPSGPSVQRWTGTSWTNATVKKWNGSAWVTPTITRY